MNRLSANDFPKRKVPMLNIVKNFNFNLHHKRRTGRIDRPSNKQIGWMVRRTDVPRKADSRPDRWADGHKQTERDGQSDVHVQICQSNPQHFGALLNLVSLCSVVLYLVFLCSQEHRNPDIKRKSSESMFNCLQGRISCTQIRKCVPGKTAKNYKN